MTEAGLHAAAMLGGRIGFVGPAPRVLNVYRETVERTGLASRIAGYRAIELRAEDYLEPQAVMEQIAALSLDLVARDGAESIVVAGAAFAGTIDQVQPLVPVPVIDGIQAGIAFAEALVGLRRPKASAGSLGALPKREIVGAGPAVTALFGGSGA
jgi:allantoin racemase